MWPRSERRIGMRSPVVGSGIKRPALGVKPDAGAVSHGVIPVREAFPLSVSADVEGICFRRRRSQAMNRAAPDKRAGEGSRGHTAFLFFLCGNIRNETRVQRKQTRRAERARDVGTSVELGLWILESRAYTRFDTLTSPASLHQAVRAVTVETTPSPVWSHHDAEKCEHAQKIFAMLLLCFFIQSIKYNTILFYIIYKTERLKR